MAAVAASSQSSAVWIFGPTDDINKHYKLGAKIGEEGQFGKAVIATKINPKPNDPAQFAVKIINKSRFLSQSSRTAAAVFDDFRREIEVLQKIDHPNVIKFYEFFEEQLKFYTVMELAQGGELFDRISTQGAYSEKKAAFVLRQLFEGLKYLHELKIAHCDLKPDNFLFMAKNSDENLKIIDFGMAKFVQKRKYFEKFCGTPYYTAPEILDGKYDEACDMWSMGVVMFVMLHGYPPFYADPSVYGAMADERIFQKIKQGFQPIVKPGYGPHFSAQISISESARDLIAKLLVPDIKKRLTAQEVLEHPWMTGEAASDSPISLSVMHSLKNFDKSNKFKLNVLRFMVNSLAQEEFEKLKATFEKMDLNHDGYITVDELKQAVKTLDSSLTSEQVAHIMSEADVDGDGNLCYQELLMTYVNRKISLKEERLWDSFCKLDKNGDGTISVDELKSVLAEEDVPNAEAILAECDTDKNGVIDYDEFLRMFSQKQTSPTAASSSSSSSATVADSKSNN